MSVLHQITAAATVVTRQDGTLAVDVINTPGCGACSQKASCAPNKSMVLDPQLADPGLLRQAAIEGSQVQLTFSASRLMRLALLCYLLPALSLCLGAIAGASIASVPDAGAFSGGCVGLLLGALSLRLYDSRSSGLGLSKPSVF